MKYLFLLLILASCSDGSFEVKEERVHIMKYDGGFCTEVKRIYQCTGNAEVTLYINKKEGEK